MRKSSRPPDRGSGQCRLHPISKAYVVNWSILQWLGFILMTRVKVFRLAAWFLTGAIAWLMLAPWGASLEPVSFDQIDKLGHALAFFLWGALITAGWQRTSWQILILAAVFGGAIELIQPLSGRDAEWADLGADMLGAGAGVWVGTRLRA